MIGVDSGRRKDFYPRPPRGGRLGHGLAFAVGNQFLSTPSARRATVRDLGLPPPGGQDFYPRPPRGGRRGHPHAQGADREFLSTPSARRATAV